MNTPDLVSDKEGPRISAEFWIDSEGAPHFQTHVTGDVRYQEMKDALESLRTLLERQLKNGRACPHYKEIK